MAEQPGQALAGVTRFGDARPFPHTGRHSGRSDTMISLLETPTHVPIYISPLSPMHGRGKGSDRLNDVAASGAEQSLPSFAIGIA